MHATKKRLVIVDDEQDITTALHYLLQESGFEVISFNDPLMALSRFTPHYYDLVILDIKMPEMNGFELYRQIRMKDNGVKVCFLTAVSEFRDYEQYKKDSFPKDHERYFVAKPISNDELIKRVNEMLSNNSTV
jgi:DNA-binding response OmpR family regulator